ncbi:MAG: hypothetical protein JSR24_13100 [Proteobacteria bacterium]|nr:hypothetical protein [Pseudomonadota bacterium]
MARTGKVIKSVATTALRAAAAAATAVVVEKMTDAIAEKVHELDRTGTRLKEQAPAAAATGKVAAKAKAKAKKAPKAKKAAKAKKPATKRRRR